MLQIAVTTRFLIWTTQRTGSTVFWRTLDRHPEIEGHGEMFLPTMTREDSYPAFVARSAWAKLEARAAPARSMRRYLTELYSAPSGTSAVGFKLMYNHLTPPLASWIAREHPKGIHLVRRNLLKLMISRVAAEQRGLYHLEPGEEPPSDRVTLDPATLLTRLEKIAAEFERGSAFAETLGALPVVYEDLVAQRDATYARVFDFLEVTPSIPAPEPLRKINPDSLSELVANLDEVKETLRGSAFESHLEP